MEVDEHMAAKQAKALRKIIKQLKCDCGGNKIMVNIIRGAKKISQTQEK